MMMRSFMITAVAAALAGCATEPQPARAFSDPAVQSLYQLPTPIYYATLSVAGRVAQNCARYTYDTPLDRMLNEERNKVGRGSLSALGLQTAIEQETDVSQRSFIAKHGVSLDSGDDLCTAADAEILAGSAMSAVLVPVN